MSGLPWEKWQNSHYRRCWVECLCVYVSCSSSWLPPPHPMDVEGSLTHSRSVHRPRQLPRPAAAPLTFLTELVCRAPPVGRLPGRGGVKNTSFSVAEKKLELWVISIFMCVKLQTWKYGGECRFRNVPLIQKLRFRGRSFIDLWPWEEAAILNFYHKKNHFCFLKKYLSWRNSCIIRNLLGNIWSKTLSRHLNGVQRWRSPVACALFISIFSTFNS